MVFVSAPTNSPVVLCRQRLELLDQHLAAQVLTQREPDGGARNGRERHRPADLRDGRKDMAAGGVAAGEVALSREVGNLMAGANGGGASAVGAAHHHGRLPFVERAGVG